MIIVLVLVGVVVLMAAVLPLTIFLRCRRIDAMRNKKLRESYAAALSYMSQNRHEWDSGGVVLRIAQLA